MEIDDLPYLEELEDELWPFIRNDFRSLKLKFLDNGEMKKYRNKERERERKKDRKTDRKEEREREK